MLAYRTFYVGHKENFTSVKQYLWVIGVTIQSLTCSAGHIVILLLFLWYEFSCFLCLFLLFGFSFCGNVFQVLPTCEDK